MTKYVSKDGKHTTTTTNPSERVDLLNQGYRKQESAPAAPAPAPTPVSAPTPKPVQADKK